jgi:drug/metabolite transporter (DMT)-like permease
LASLAENRRGILAMLGGMASFVVTDSCVKLATEGLPVGEIIALRGIFSIACTVGIVVALGEWRHVRAAVSPLVVGRGLLEAVVAVTYITALAHLPIANITAILQAAPIILTLFAVVVGIERVGWRRWLAILAGFLGVLIIVRPGAAGFNAWSLLALLSAVILAFRDLATRRIGATAPSSVITLATTVAVAAVGVAMSIAETWHMPTATQMLYVTLAGIAVSLGNFCVVVAFRGSDIAVVSPFRYSIIVWAIIAGFVVFGDKPDLPALAGILLIGGSGFYTLHRERVRARAAAALAAQQE